MIRTKVAASVPVHKSDESGADSTYIDVRIKALKGLIIFELPMLFWFGLHFFFYITFFISKSLVTKFSLPRCHSVSDNFVPK